MDKFDEWEIGNFSCWSNDLHGDVLKTGSSSLELQLYPRGIGGKGEQLLLRIDKPYILEGSLLSFIGSDGSVICTRQSDADWGEDEYMINFTGPKFEEVVAIIRGKEPVYKDRLTLRWMTPQGQGFNPERYFTVIDATFEFFQIKPNIFDLKNNYVISEIYSELQNEVCQKILVRPCKTGSTPKNTKVKFTLQSYLESKFISRTSIWMAKGNNIIQKYEDYRLVNNYEQQVLFEIPYEELFGIGFQTIMRFKIISARLRYYRCYSNLMLPARIKITDFLKLSVENSSSPMKPDNTVTVLLKDLVCLYQDQEFADFEMRCDTVSFPTHKNILSARSPVLKAMLSGNMKEAASGHVNVDDLDPHTLGRFLSFLYSGATGEEALHWEEASKLYYAADKYQVPSLKEECAAVLRDSVALENVCDILSLADKHQDEELRSIAHEFILENYNDVLGSENWEKLTMSDPVLAAKTLTIIVKNNSLKKITLSN